MSATDDLVSSTLLTICIPFSVFSCLPYVVNSYLEIAYGDVFPSCAAMRTFAYFVSVSC